MKKILKSIQNENAVTVLLILISFAVYLMTMSRSVGFTDSGELATVVYTLGIAHPTGYPLFTLLGRCWSMIPFPGEEILRLNALCALLTAVAVGIFFKVTIAFRRSSTLFHSRNRKQDGTSDSAFLFASVLASLIVGFSTTFWSQAVEFEVYALHLVLVLLTMWAFICGIDEQVKEQLQISRKLFLFAFILGLSFSNHMTTILLAPGFLWLYFHVFGYNKTSFGRTFTMVPMFLLGLSIYFYLPVRSSSHPLLDWGHPATLERLFWHISGKQFRVWMFSGWDVVQKQLMYYRDNIFSEFHFVVIVCMIVGALYLWKRSRQLLVFLALLFCTTILYAVNYDIFDIGSYFLLSYLVLGWFSAFGICSLLQWSKDKHGWMNKTLAVMVVAIPLGQIALHWNNADETMNRLPEQFVAESFSHLEPHAVVISSQWDYWISPSLYYQFIGNSRRDITVIDKSLLQNRSWYFLQMEQQAPWLMQRIRSSADLFLGELYKFEHEIPFNFTHIQTRWQNLLLEIVEKSIVDHPVYVDVRIERDFSPAFYRVPSGLFIRLTTSGDSVSYHTARTSFTVWNKGTSVTNDFEKYYIMILLYDAEWLFKHKRESEAKTVLLEVLQFEPSNFAANWMMAQIVKN